MPKRIQRRRTAGWRMPGNAVYVGRPSRWGNPIAVGMYVQSGAASTYIRTPADAVLYYRLATRNGWARMDDGPMWRPPSDGEIRYHLGGRDLVCWCPLPEPGQPDHCHAAVLLAIANT